jgi:polysaccharide export outer membrane protein
MKKIKMDLRRSNTFYPVTKLGAVALLLFFLFSCGVTGDVVKIREVGRDNALAGLKKEDLARLEELKKGGAVKGIDPTINSVIKKTPHYTVEEYLKGHPEMRNATASDYKVGGYDVLNVVVYEEKDLSRDSVRVSADGFISFPLIGRVKVSDLNTSEVERLISQRLAEEQYLFDAHVSVIVTQYLSRRAIVLGAVKTPGSYPLQAQERVLDVVSKAGGIGAASGVAEMERAGGRALIIRTEAPDTEKERKIVIDIDLEGLLRGGQQTSNILMWDKDILYVPPADYFYIIGQVRVPGSYALRNRDVTLVEAISMSGGFTPIAARNKTRIIRVEDGVQKIIEVAVDAITHGGKKVHDIVIQPHDIIIVPESFF